MGWKLELVEAGRATASRRIAVACLGEIVVPTSVEDIGLNHGTAQRILGDVQRAVVAEGLANALVNRRMNKLQQMRWSTAGAHAVVTVRANLMNEASYKMPTTNWKAA